MGDAAAVGPRPTPFRPLFSPAEPTTQTNTLSGPRLVRGVADGEAGSRRQDKRAAREGVERALDRKINKRRLGAQRAWWRGGWWGFWGWCGECGRPAADPSPFPFPLLSS